MASAPEQLLPGISVVIPVYNSEKSLEPLLDRLGKVLPTLAGRYEVILVNDGSRDDSWGVIRRLIAERPWLRAFNLMRNYGQHNALLCGIRAARYDTTVTMDDDLQHPPEEIAKLLAEIERGFDVVYGTPLQQQHGLWRDLASRMTKLAMQSAIGFDNARKVSAFRAFRTKTRQAFSEHSGPYVNVDVVLTWASNKFSSVAVPHDLRLVGKSNYTFGKLVVHAINMTTGFSTLPLRVTAIMGFGLTLFGVGVLLYVLIRYVIQGSTVPGFPFLASLLSIFSGAQLFALGVIGEYLARMHFRMMDRPTYTVREISDLPSEHMPAER